MRLVPRIPGTHSRKGSKESNASSGGYYDGGKFLSGGILEGLFLFLSLKFSRPAFPSNMFLTLWDTE